MVTSLPNYLYQHFPIALHPATFVLPQTLAPSHGPSHGRGLFGGTSRHASLCARASTGCCWLSEVGDLKSEI